MTYKDPFSVYPEWEIRKGRTFDHVYTLVGEFVLFVRDYKSML